MDAKKGALLVRIAREAIESHVKSGNARPKRPANVPPEFSAKSGVFVTLHTYPEKELRGCIGYPEPVMPLMEALLESAVHACHDPRFPPLSKGELAHVIVEVSVLTPPVPIRVKSPEEYPGKIKIGRDGLIIEKGYSRGLLLPQVPVEWNWDAHEFLENLCHKAGLPGGAWKREGVKILSFRSEIFAEEKPGGPAGKSG
ncbi:MAG: TIGR00296 family protein [Candidatus Aenigmatarchaeota archaeon]